MSMLKVVWNIIKKVFGIFCVILSPLKRLWCRARKRRDSDTILPLTNHYPSVENLNSNHNGTRQVNEELSPWDTWEDNSAKINSVQKYREQQEKLQHQQSQEDQPQDMDYFSDMTPKVKKQKKVLIQKADDSINTNVISSKLAMATDIPINQSSELGNWEETNTAWEAEADEDLSWEAENVIREKRKAERQQKLQQNQRKKQEKEHQKQTQRGTNQGQFSAVRLS